METIICNIWLLVSLYSFEALMKMSVITSRYATGEESGHISMHGSYTSTGAENVMIHLKWISITYIEDHLPEVLQKELSVENRLRQAVAEELPAPLLFDIQVMLWLFPLLELSRLPLQQPQQSSQSYTVIFYW